MRHSSIIILLVFLTLITSWLPTSATISGRIDYSIPIDYSKLSQSELEDKVKVYYFNALKLKDGEINNDITNALIIYSVLQKIEPESFIYCIKLGTLYDKINMDKYSKSNFSRAIGIDNTRPESYFGLGEFYYKREMYRKALKYYNEAYQKGYQTNFDMLCRMGDIYEKFGDTHSALKYLKEASSQSSTPELENLIKRVETQHSINKEYYSDTRIKIPN